jgi:geranylgeranyl pyrophosphate synthase
MWQDRQAELLRRETEVLLKPLSDTAGLHSLINELLNESRQRLVSESDYSHPWPLLPLIVCESISGHYERALPAAVALRLFVIAGDIFDDIEDADSSESLSARCGSAIATNIATTFLILAEKAITRLKSRDVKDYVIVRVMDVINSSFTTTCAGQHLDLCFNLEVNASEDTYLKIADMKTASTIQCACHVGALLATSNQELINTFAMFGRNLGMASQIANDIQGITRGNDILKRKITLPVIYALSQLDIESRHQLELMFNKQSESALNPELVRDLLFRSGAIQYAAIKMELYKQRARDILLQTEVAVASVERLRIFLK